MTRSQFDFIAFGLAVVLASIAVLFIQSIFGLPFLFLPVFGIVTGFVLAKGLKNLHIISAILFVDLFCVQHIYFNNLSFAENISIAAATTLATAIMSIVSLQIFTYFKTNTKDKESVQLIKSTFIISLIAPIFPALLAPLIYFNFDKYPGSMIFESFYRVYLGGVLGVSLFAPLVYIIFNTKIKKTQKASSVLYFSIIVLFSTLLLTMLELNNKNSLDKKVQDVLLEVKYLTIKNLEEKIILTHQFKNKFIKDFKSKRIIKNNVQINRELEKMNIKNKSVKGFALFVEDDGVLVLRDHVCTIDSVEPFPGHLDMNKLSLPGDNRYAPIISLLKTSGSEDYVFIGFPVVTEKGAEVFGISLDMSNVIKNEVLAELNSPDMYIFDIRVDSKLNDDMEVKEVYRASDSSSYPGSEARSFYLTEQFTHWGVSFNVSVSAPTTLWFALSTPQHWVVLSLFVLGVLSSVIMILSLLYKDIKLHNVINDLEVEIKSKELFQHKLSNLNRNLELQVRSRSEELMTNIRDRELLFKSFPDTIFKINKDGMMLDYNVGNKAINGIVMGNYIGKHISNYLPEEKSEVFINAVNTAIKDDSIQLYDYTYVVASKKVFLETRIVKFDENTVMAYVQNVTEKKQLEAKVEEQNMKALTNAKLASLGEMAGGIAHEINNPLSIIDGSAQLVTAMIEKNEFNTDKAQSSLYKIHNTVQRIAKIINGLKKFARSSNEFEYVDMDLFCEEILSFCYERFKIRGIRLDLTNNLINKNIFCNQVELSQVLINLLNNAHDAVTGSVDKWVSVELVELKNVIHINVKDSGRGVPKSIRGSIMTPFFTTKKVGSGTGLGLSISKTIIENHNGNLEFIESEEYTCFRVTLPKYITSTDSVKPVSV